MHLVRNARPTLALALIAAAVVLTSCGGDGSEEEAASGQGPDIKALPINLADCEDWNDASVEQRLATIRQIRDYTGGPVQGSSATEGSSARGSVLDDDVAYDYFDQYCENEFARGFKLYKLYGRAAAFGARGGE